MTMSDESEFQTNEEFGVQPDGGKGAIPEYDELATEAPEIKVSDESGGAKTITESEEDTVQKTDVQAILKVLTPKFADKSLDDVLQPAMVSRIFPDNLLDKMKLLVLRELQRHKPTDEIDLIMTISAVQDALAIGYEGRGIADRLEVAGVVHEEEMEKLTKELGF